MIRKIYHLKKKKVIKLKVTREIVTHLQRKTHQTLISNPKSQETRKDTLSPEIKQLLTMTAKVNKDFFF